MDADKTARVGGPVRRGWQEGTLTRAKELESLAAWVRGQIPPANYAPLGQAIAEHLDAAREAARAAELDPRRRFRLFRNGALLERALSNLDAAEADLLTLAPSEYLLAQLPSLLTHAQSHLMPNDPRRLELEQIGQRLGLPDSSHPLVARARNDLSPADKNTIVTAERGKIVAAARAASSAKLREHVRLRSFRNTLIVAALIMTLIALGVAIVGLVAPRVVPLCFAPENGGTATVVCPTGQSVRFTVPTPNAGPDIDDYVQKTVTRYDLLIVEFVGLVAAALAAAAAVRGIRGSSERLGLPIALALLKLPTGAITAFLGLLLMRGQFVPGLSALDTSAQILAWALVFGYAQQLFTRMVDSQGQSVLDSVRGADKARPALTPP